MKNRFYRFIVVCVLALIVFSLSFIFIFSNHKLVSKVTSPVANVVTKVDSVLSYPLSLFSQMSDSVGNLLSTYSENQNLKKAIADMKNQSSTISILEKENASLKSSLNLSKEFSDQKVLTGLLNVRSTTSWLDVATVNLGSTDGVENSMVVTSDGGVIGVITGVSSDTSTVSLLSNSGDDISVAVRIETDGSSGTFGVITNYDQDSNLLEITQLNRYDDIKVGSEVVTSALDDVSVEGVPVGKVTSISNDDGKRTVYVKPIADFDSISYVTLIGRGK